VAAHLALVSTRAATFGKDNSDTHINLTITTLTGDMTPTQKNHALLAIISGDANIIIGTHALIQDTVKFYDLGLVIIDEQHRFGVEQRDSLRTKGKNHTTPHLLVMTATPIPRTIAMTFFGTTSLLLHLQASSAASFLTGAAMIAVTLFEVFVAVLQAYIFPILSAVYIKLSIEAH